MDEPDDPTNPVAKRKWGKMKRPPDWIGFSSLRDQKINLSFLIIKRTEDESFTKLSPFYINKFVTGLVGEERKIKNI